MEEVDTTNDITVERASPEDRTLIAGLMQKYLKELSEHTGQQAQGDGRYRYPYLPLYWLEEERHPFVIRVKRKTAGFALVRGVRGGTSMAEFFIVPDLRHQGVGRSAAQTLFRMFPGRWVVQELITNADAQAFWRSVIKEVDPKFSDRIVTSPKGISKSEQRFTVAPSNIIPPAEVEQLAKESIAKNAEALEQLKDL